MKNVQGGCSACSGEHLHLLILPLTCSLQFSLLDVSDTECTCAKSLSQVQFFESLWTVPPPPDSSVHGILQARILEWVATRTSR